MQKPYYIKSEGIDAGTHIRVAGTTRPADEYMIQELRLEGSRRSYDEMPCIGVEITEDDIADLCKRMKEEAVYNTLNEEEKKTIRDVTVEQLLSWRVIGERNGKYYPNNAYAILTGDYRVPNTIQCGVFKGSTKAFSYMKLMEKWGSGIPRVVREVCDEGLAVPVFEGGEVDLVVNIYRKDNIANTAKTADQSGGDGGSGVKTGGELSEEETKIITYLAVRPTATQKEISSDTNIPLRTVQRILPRLQEKAVLVRVGNRRSGKWKLIE